MYKNIDYIEKRINFQGYHSLGIKEMSFIQLICQFTMDNGHHCHLHGGWVNYRYSVPTPLQAGIGGSTLSVTWEKEKFIINRCYVGDVTEKIIDEKIDDGPD